MYLIKFTQIIMTNNKLSILTIIFLVKVASHCTVGYIRSNRSMVMLFVTIDHELLQWIRVTKDVIKE